MRLYATPTDLVPDWLDELPGNAARLIRAASTKVEHATRMAHYAVDDDGYPTQPAVKNAMRDAVCQQVTAWSMSELDPNAGTAGQALYVQSQTVDGGSVTFGGHVSVEERTAAATGLGSEAMEILANAGLLTSDVTVL